MIRLRYFLLLLLLISGCKDRDTDNNTESAERNTQNIESQVAPSGIGTKEYSDVNNIDEILTYSIPDSAQEIEGPPASNETKAVDYVVDGKLIGRKTVYQNGNTATIVLYKDDKLHGCHQGWYENGQLRFQVFYNMGIPCHWSRFWHDNGQLKLEIFIKDGLQHGTYRQWGREGKLLGEFEFTMGNGEAFEWHENGNVKSHVRMVNGKPHGILKEWDEDGNLLEESTIFFLNGKEVDEDAYYDARKADLSLPDFDEVGK
jgi:antitoxin component YwqK of YwqJK toxin-antitoxin module